MKSTLKNFFYLGIVAVVAAMGCIQQTPLPSDLPSLVPCSLVITQDGGPLSGATISLRTLEERQLWIGGGRTDDQGKVEIFTNGRYKGAPLGKYKIIVTKTETEPSKLPPRPPEDSPEFGAWMNKAQNEKLTTYSLAEKQYADPKTSPLEIEISGSKAISATFDAGKKVRVKVN